jgi:hypothetical protein
VNYNNKNIPIEDIRAESIIAVMFDDIIPEVRNLGSFYRNYCEDIIRIGNESDRESIVVELSRDGIYYLLPETLFFLENRLLIKKSKNIINSEIANESAIKDEVKKQNAEKKHLFAFFKFFDIQYFETKLLLEKEIFDLENNQINFILKNLFDYDLDKEENEYIKKIAPLLIYCSRIRGDLLLLSEILSAALKHRVEINKRNIFIDQSSESVVLIEFIVHIEGLSLKEYQELTTMYKPFLYFINEWFFPAGEDYVYKIKDTTQKFDLNEKQIILDYNTQLLAYESE